MFLYQLNWNECFTLDCDTSGEVYRKIRGDGMYCWCYDASGKEFSIYMAEEVTRVEG